MTTGTEAKDQMAALAQEREVAKIQMSERVAQMDNEHPEANIKAKGNWWTPSIDFGFDVKGRLDTETQEKLNACLQRMVDQKYAPAAVDSSLDEARGYLAGHKDLLAQFDKIFGNHAIWDAMYKSEQEKGSNSGGSFCARKTVE